MLLILMGVYVQYYSANQPIMKYVTFKENKIGNEKLRALGLEVFDPSLSQFLMGGSVPHRLFFELI